MRGWLILLLLLPPFAAHADEAYREAYLRCDPAHDSFVVRFGLRFNDDPVETAELALTALPVARQLQGQPLASENSCTLSNGTTVKLSVLEGQAFAYGQGGGDPDVTFTLSFNGAPLYFQKAFYTGYGSLAYSARYDVSALAYDGQTLLACPGTTAAVTSEPIPAPTPCEDESNRLQILSKPFAEAFATFSDKEQTRLIDDLRRRQLRARLSPFCRELETAEKSFADVTFEHYQTDATHALATASIDIDNDGKSERVVQVSDDRGYFDGSFLVVYPNDGAQEPDEETLLGIDPENVRQEFASHKWPATLISLNDNVSPRYSRNEVFAYERKNYILSSTANRSMIPARLVSILTADSPIPKTLCEYP